MGQQKMAVWGEGEVLPYISYIAMCRRKGRGFGRLGLNCRAWDKGYNNSQTPPPTPTGTPTARERTQVELLILNLRYVIKWYGLKREYSINKLVSVLS